MRSHHFALIALSAFCSLAGAGVVHVDVSSNGDIAIDINPEQRDIGDPPKLPRTARPVANPRNEPEVFDDDYIVEIWPGKHRGFLEKKATLKGTVEYVRFSNIPYADPPVEDLRFFRSLPPSNESSEINEGLTTKICPQHQVGWFNFAGAFGADWVGSSPIDKKWSYPITPENNYTYPPPTKELPPGVEMSEDCLYLDVMVPKAVWDKRNERSDFKSAVIVWIHGGGFIFGNKNQHGSPIGLFTRATNETEQNIIYVTMNYRLGAFGWLGGDKFKNDGAEPNVGLWDQKLALEWVQHNIYAFGGDSRRVTVMGQSAGASSIMHHITGFGGYASYRPPIRQAILLSPGFFPQPDNGLEDSKYQKFLELTGTKDLDELLKLPKDSPDLIEANAMMTYNSSYGLFEFGPTIDGYFVPELPGAALKKGNFHDGFPLLLGYTRNDGVAFTPPWIRSNAALGDHVRQLFPNVPQSALDYVEANYTINPDDNEREKLRQTANFLDDIAIQCNAHYLTQANLKSSSNLYHPTYRYVFNAWPAMHGTDVDYTYWPEDPLLGVPPNGFLAAYMQKRIVDFVRYTDPNDEGDETWKPYTNNQKKVMNYGNPDDRLDYRASFDDDKLNTDHCDYWQDAPYYVPKKSRSAQLVRQSNSYKESL